jgi:drug/metabolite transporter (DMT)-like permease
LKQIKVHLVLLFVTLIYAITFSIAKDIMPTYVGSSAMVFFRILGALILFWTIAPLEKYFFVSALQTKIETKDFKKLFVAAMFGVAFNMLLFFKGLQLSYPINGAVLMLNTPIFVLLIAWITGSEKLGFKKIAGILLAAFGAALLMLGKKFQFSEDTLLGDLFVTINAVFYAYYLVYVRKLLSKYTVITVSKWTFLFGLLIVTPFAINELQQINFSHIPPFIYLEIAFVVFFTTFVAYLLNAWAIEKGGSVIVGSYIYLQPLFATYIAVSLGKDNLTVTKVIAAIVLFVGVFLSSDKQQEIMKKNLGKLYAKVKK